MLFSNKALKRLIIPLVIEQILVMLVGMTDTIMVVSIVFHSAILRLLFGAIETDVMEAAVTYFIITAFSFPFLGIYNSSAALFRTMQKTSITMYVSLLMNIINIVGNAIGIFVFHAGVAGVAIPTLLSRAVAAVIMTALAFNAKNEVHITLKGIFSWNKEAIKKILHIAIPSGIENGLFAFGKVLVTSCCDTIDG